MDMARTANLFTALALILALPLAACTAGQETRTSPLPAAAESQSSRGEATIVAIDKKDRLVTLRRQDGNLVAMQASPEVRNFDQLKVGDKVWTQLVESVVMVLRKPGEATVGASSGENAMRAQPGEMPAASLYRYVTVTSEVVQVNPATNTLVIKGPDGLSRTLNVKRPEYQRRLPELKAGDLIEATYTETMMIGVERPG
jgi:hypothetical protein